MDVQNTTEMEDPPLAKAVKKIQFQIFRDINTVFNVCNSNANRFANSTVDNIKSFSKADFIKRMPENNTFPSVIVHRL